MNNPYHSNPPALSPNRQYQMPQNTQQRESIVSQLFKNSPVVTTQIATNQQNFRSNEPDGTSITELKKMSNTQMNRTDPANNQNTHIDDARLLKEINERKVRHLVKDINRGLNEYDVPSTHYTDDSDSYNETDDSVRENEFDESRGKFGKYHEKNSYVPDILKDPIICIIIYVVISQSFVQRALGNYISHVVPRADGTVSFVGQLILGTILGILFVFFKKVIK